MKKNCGIIRDMLPLYVENMCGDESRNFVNEHLAQCSECMAELDKLNKNVAVKADTDISAIRKVKRKIRAGKIVVAVAALLIGFCAAFFGLYIPLSLPCSMDYDKYGLAENVWVEEDDNGDVWLCRKDAAASADIVLTNLRDSDGNLMSDEIYSPKLKKIKSLDEINGGGSGFDKDKMEGLDVTLQHIRFRELSFLSELGTKEVRSKILNTSKNDKINYVAYYDDVNDREIVIWERK